MGKAKGIKKSLNITKYLLPKNIAILLVKTCIKDKIPYAKSLKEHYKLQNCKIKKHSCLISRILVLCYILYHLENQRKIHRKIMAEKGPERKTIQLILVPCKIK